MAGYAGIGCRAQVVEDQASVFVELAHFLSDVGYALRLDHADGEAAKPGDVFVAVAGADTAAVRVIVPVHDVVAAIFDNPMAAVGVKDTAGIGLFLRWAGDAVGDFIGAFAALFFDSFPLDGP